MRSDSDLLKFTHAIKIYSDIQGKLLCKVQSFYKSTKRSCLYETNNYCFNLISVVLFLTFTGVKKGDRVAIYMPMINELVVAMLACARIGAVHSIVVSHN